MAAPVSGSNAIFPRLRGGRGGIGRERTERHQRGRLEGAMVEAVARHGYAGTTVRELVALAGVSKSTFYEHFENKQECFLATFETIVIEAQHHVQAAYRSGHNPRQQLSAAIERFVGLVTESPEAAALVTVASLSLGTAATAYRQDAAEAFEAMFRQSIDEYPGAVELTDLDVRIVLGGAQTIVYRRLREGEAERLEEDFEYLLEWALAFRSARSGPGSPPRRGRLEARAAGSGGDLPWSEPPNSPRSRAALSQRERILRAAAQVAAERGYQGLTIPAISARAGTSNQTFYEHFANKEEVFIAAFDELTERATLAAYAALSEADNWWEAVEGGTLGMLRHIAEEPLFARLAYFELPMAGEAALARADAAMASFTEFLEPQELPPELEPVPAPVREAIAGGAWTAVQHEIARGNALGLPRMAPEFADALLRPLRHR